MKTFLIILTFLIFLTGCSSKSAFSRFNMTQEQELSIDSNQRSKVKFGDKMNGIISLVYLNMISPKIYKDFEYFYVDIYLKDKTYESRFLLNNIEAISIEKLPSKNEFTDLTSIDAPWSQYYLVIFPKQGDKLSFVFENGPYTSDPLRFEKDE